MDRFARTGILTTLLLATLAGCDSAQVKLRNQGIAQYNAGQYQMAMDTFDKGLTYDQFTPVDHYYAGASAMNLGKYEQAIYHLKLAWQADPSMAEVKEAMTECLLRQGHEDRALDFLERDAALTAKTKDPRPLKQINNRPYMSQKEERMFLGKGGDRLRVARTYEKIGDLENARVNYVKAVEMQPDDAATHFTVGGFYERVGNKDAAALEYRKTYQLDAQYPQLIPALARVGLQPMQ